MVIFSSCSAICTTRTWSTTRNEVGIRSRVSRTRSSGQSRSHVSSGNALDATPFLESPTKSGLIVADSPDSTGFRLLTTSELGLEARHRKHTKVPVCQHVFLESSTIL